MKCENFVLAAEIPCEWKFATKFASECECDGLVHSGEVLQSLEPEPVDMREKASTSKVHESPTPEPAKESEKVGSSEVHHSSPLGPVKESEKVPMTIPEGMVGWLSRSKAYSLAKEKVIAILVVAQMQVELAKTFIVDSLTHVQDGTEVAKTSIEKKMTQLRASVKAGYDATLERTSQVKIHIIGTYESTMTEISAVKGVAVERYEVLKIKAMEGAELAQWIYEHPKEAFANIQTVAYDGTEQARDMVTSRIQKVTTSAKETATLAATKVRTKVLEGCDYASSIASMLGTKAGEAVETSKWAVMNPREATTASIAAVKEGWVKVQAGGGDAGDKAFKVYLTCKSWADDTYTVYKELATQTYYTAQETAITKKSEAVEAYSHAVAATSTKISDVSQSAKLAVMDPKNQATAASALAGGAAMGATGGTAGFVAGGTAGAVLGVVPALFTFGLSIPIGAAIGAGLGSAIGAVGGGAVGAVSGGMAGREVYERRDDIKSSASSTWSKACKYSEVAKSSATERMTQVRQRLYKPTGETAAVQ